MRVFLTDDEEKVRSALRLLLEMEPDIDVVGETAEAEALLAQVEEMQPDVVLLDWELTDAFHNGLLPTLHARCPHLQVIALSGLPEARGASLAAGADAFVSKSDPPDRLLDALRSAVRLKGRGHIN
jgi:DNA-binding NarL/FixJ family response regulator